MGMKQRRPLGFAATMQNKNLIFQMNILMNKENTPCRTS
jgi:hypothetical protein